MNYNKGVFDFFFSKKEALHFEAGRMQEFFKECQFMKQFLDIEQVFH